MDGAVYLMNYGWTQGEALKMGGLKKPILVKHKKDQKGLGHNADQQEAWWERVFDGQLKGLDVNTGSGSSSSVSFTQREVKVSAISKNVSPLYRMFRYGGILEGSLKEAKVTMGGDNKNDAKVKSKSKNKSKGSDSSDSEKKKSSKKSHKSKDKEESTKKKSSSKDKDLKKDKSSKKVKKSGKVEKERKSSSSSKKSKSKSSSKTTDQLEAEWVKQIMAQVNQSVQTPA